MADHTQHGSFHECECYGHNVELPDYKHDISVPKTLQGYYAKAGGCPCRGKKCSDHSLCCSTVTDQKLQKETYRPGDGPHTVYPAASVETTNYPNARNYGGTVSQRGPTTLTTAAQLTDRNKRRSEKKEERLQDRKNFLRAVLRDEMLARMDAEAMRGELEQNTGLMGPNHAVDYETMNGTGMVSGNKPRGGINERGINEIPSIGEQYAEIMEELDYVAGRPVGSKFNIIRLHYLVEEEERINALRMREKMATRANAMKK